ncbi:hypothetical protein ACVWXP_003493 [Bradyrhizobium sp. USDA 4463]
MPNRLSPNVRQDWRSWNGGLSVEQSHRRLMNAAGTLRQPIQHVERDRPNREPSIIPSTRRVPWRFPVDYGTVKSGTHVYGSRFRHRQTQTHRFRSGRSQWRPPNIMGVLAIVVRWPADGCGVTSHQGAHTAVLSLASRLAAVGADVLNECQQLFRFGSGPARLFSTSSTRQNCLADLSGRASTS